MTNCEIPYLLKYGMNFFSNYQKSGAFVIIAHEISAPSLWVFSTTSVISSGGHFLFE